MRKPLNTSIPEEMIAKVDEVVQDSHGEFKDRSHFVEQAIKSYLEDDFSLRGLLAKSMNNMRDTNAAASLYETSLFPRLSINVEEKHAIAEKAVDLISEGKTIFLDGGSTCLQFAKQLVMKKKGLTIVTNSALICLELGQSGENVVIGVSGQFFPRSASFIGPSAEEAIERYYVDFAIFSTKGFLPSEGTFESAEGTLRMKQKVAQRCDRLVLLIDHTKFEQRSLFKVLDISQIDTIVTDDKIPEKSLSQLREKSMEVLIAPVSGNHKGGS